MDRISLKEISVVKAEPVIYNTTEKREKAQGCPPFRKVVERKVDFNRWEIG